MVKLEGIYALGSSVLFLLTITSRSTTCKAIPNNFVVCSYNIWNLMFSWEIRLRYIAYMVKEAGCEILVLQEVRQHRDKSWSQALQLQRLLPAFRWVLTKLSGNLATKPEGSYWTGWEMEGLAVMSQWPVGQVKVHTLTRNGGQDTNPRIVVFVPVILNADKEVNIVSVHFSYDRFQQCQNAVEVLQFIQVHNLRNVIVAGDFNTYPDFPEPISLFTGHFKSQQEKTTFQCGSVTWSHPPNDKRYVDVWEESHGSGNHGWTFSNMPTPGLVSRPDRILVSRNFHVLHTSLHGNGSTYAHLYKYDILLHRFWVVVQAAISALMGKTGYSCLQDCGPHGSCRCGVCIKGGNNNSCLLPDCPECSPMLLMAFLVYIGLFCYLILLALLASVKILVIASDFNKNTSLVAYGCTCCLCNPLLIRSSTLSSRHWLGRCLWCLGLRRVPPAYLLLSSTLLIILCILGGGIIFSQSLETLHSLMAEELFPSDHLLLVVNLQIS